MEKVTGRSRGRERPSGVDAVTLREWWPLSSRRQAAGSGIDLASLPHDPAEELAARLCDEVDAGG